MTLTFKDTNLIVVVKTYLIEKIFVDKEMVVISVQNIKRIITVEGKLLFI